jgi:hypothetical protein
MLWYIIAFHECKEGFFLETYDMVDCSTSLQLVYNIFVMVDWILDTWNTCILFKHNYGSKKKIKNMQQTSELCYENGCYMFIFPIIAPKSLFNMIITLILLQD